MAIPRHALSELAFRPALSRTVSPNPGGATIQPLRRPAQRAPQETPPAGFDLARLADEFTTLQVRYEADQASLWCGFQHGSRPCFTPELLDEITCLQERLRAGLAADAMLGRPGLRTVVWHSSTPDVWNLGGDLMLFVRLIRTRAEEALRRYAYACVRTVYQNWTKLDLPVLTVALVQGDALGGGFEAVLTNDVIIAERQSKFGLPEILFNMFPGMGAYSLLSRRLDGVRADRMITSGRLYEAEELAEMGLVDRVVEPGEGVAAVREYLARNQRRHALLEVLSQVRRRCQPLTYEELIEVTDLWVATAMRLDEADLRRMERLAAAQERRRARESGPAPADAAPPPRLENASAMPARLATRGPTATTCAAAPAPGYRPAGARQAAP